MAQERKLPLRIALAIASTLAALAFAEGCVRVLGLAPSRWAHPWHVETSDKRLGLDVYPDDPRGYFPIDLREESARRRYRARLPEVDERFERTPHAIEFVYTRELCRGDTIAPREPGRARVLAIGDSFTEGQGVLERDTWAAALGARLQTEVLNCGRRGYDFPALHELLDRNLVLEPDVVIYAMILNDPEQSAAFHARQEYIDDWILDRRRMYTEGDGSPPPWESRLYGLLHDRIEAMQVGAETTRWYREIVGSENRDGWRATLDHIEAMDRTMRERGGAFVVALWPLMIELGDYPFEETHRTIAREIEARGVRFVDTLGSFRGRRANDLWVHPSDRHPNERAHAIFARRLAPVVREELRARRTRS
jgi:lysophospholipase L1-like esterase